LPKKRKNSRQRITFSKEVSMASHNISIHRWCWRPKRFGFLAYVMYWNCTYFYYTFWDVKINTQIDSLILTPRLKLYTILAGLWCGHDRSGPWRKEQQYATSNFRLFLWTEHKASKNWCRYYSSQVYISFDTNMHQFKIPGTSTWCTEINKILD
jgi:hypothetical protein